MGRQLIILGLILVAAGVLISYGPRFPFRLGRLPGDIHIEGKNSSFYSPVTTCILISVIASLVMWILRRLR